MNVFFIAVVSANGKISRSHSSIVDWNSREDLEWFKDLTLQAGVVVMGRKTFEIIGHPLPKRLNVVISHNSPNRKMKDVVFTDERPAMILKKLQKKSYEQVAIIGGQSIFTTFLKEKLIDEMYITYEPILIEGIDMFESIGKDVKLKVLDLKKLGSGAIVVHYAFKK